LPLGLGAMAALCALLVACGGTPDNGGGADLGTPDTSQGEVAAEVDAGDDVAEVTPQLDADAAPQPDADAVETDAEAEVDADDLADADPDVEVAPDADAEDDGRGRGRRFARRRHAP
jgi:hypothetical protein